MAQNDMRAAAVFGAKTEIISDLPPTAISTLAASSTSTRFRNLDQSVALARAGSGKERSLIPTRTGRHLGTLGRVRAAISHPGAVPLRNLARNGEPCSRVDGSGGMPRGGCPSRRDIQAGRS
jgi:hypothetical protein